MRFYQYYHTARSLHDDKVQNRLCLQSSGQSEAVINAMKKRNGSCDHTNNWSTYSSLKGQGRLFKEHSNNLRRKISTALSTVRAKRTKEASIQKCQWISRTSARLDKGQIKPCSDTYTCVSIHYLKIISLPWASNEQKLHHHTWKRLELPEPTSHT